MIQNAYKDSRKLRDYVDKYCVKHGLTVEEALQHELVKQVYLMYSGND